MIFNQSKNKHVIFSEVLHCLRITFHRRRGGRMEGTLSPSLLMCWSPSTYLSILAFKTVKLRGRTLFCLQSSYLNIQRLWRQLITPQRKSSVTPHKSIHPLSWSPALTVLSSSCQHMVTLTCMVFRYHRSRHIFARWSCHLVLLTVKVSVPALQGDRNGAKQSNHGTQLYKRCAYLNLYISFRKLSEGKGVQFFGVSV